MLQTATLAALSSDNKATKKCRGSVSSVQMVTCISGGHPSKTGLGAQNAHSARRKKSASITKAPAVAAQWDYEANADLGTPHTVVSQCHTAVDWLCHDCGHCWTARINDRVHRQTGCPKCGPGHSMRGQHSRRPTFADSQHPLLAQWDHKGNAAQGNFPNNTTEGSRKQIHWFCPCCPAGQEHSWVARPSNRTGKHATGCPFCSGKAACKCNSLEALYLDRAAEWDYERNTGQPSDYPAGSNHVVWWRTPKRGSWQQSILGRTIGADADLAKRQLAKDRTRS